MDDIAFPGGNGKSKYSTVNKLLDVAAREPIDPHAPWVWRQTWSTLKSTTRHWLGLDGGAK
jgi:hypothetical protein